MSQPDEREPNGLGEVRQASAPLPPPLPASVLDAGDPGVDHGAIVFGLTGAFGSGCSTLAAALEKEMGFGRVKISDLIREESQSREITAKRGGLATPPRRVLQDIGDELRKERSRSYWAEEAARRLESAGAGHNGVIDGIRNPAEAEWLRRRYKNFYLVAVDAHPTKRWTRLQQTDDWKSESLAAYEEISSRDIEAPEDWGQRVQQCVDMADVLIANDQDETEPKARALLLAKAQDFLKLCAGPHRRPHDDEYFMHLAYGSSSGSACLKRQVGAVIVRPGATRELGLGESPLKQAATVVGVGYNENSDWMQPCYLEYRACYRDIWRKEQWEKRDLRNCPHCGHGLNGVTWPYTCPNEDCRRSLLLTLFPERAMTRCTAIHAEVRAIQACSGIDLAGCHLYSTTMPCFLCSEQILQANIAQVVYFEAYPDKEAEELLTRHGVVVKRFEGVKSLAFGRFFGSWRSEAEKEMALSG